MSGTFDEANIILMPKLDNDTKRKKSNYNLVFLGT